MTDASRKFSNMWLDNQPFSVTTTSTSMNPKFYDCTSQINLDWRQCKRPFSSSSRDATGNGCTPETNLHMIIFSGAVSSNSQPSDDENFQNAAVLRDYAGRYRPGSWIGVGPGSEKTWQLEGNLDRRTLHVVDTYTASGHQVIPGTTIFKQTNLRQKEARQHALEFKRTICQYDFADCFVIESSVHAPRYRQVRGRLPRPDTRRRQARQLCKCEGSLNTTRRTGVSP